MENLFHHYLSYYSILVLTSDILRLPSALSQELFLGCSSWRCTSFPFENVLLFCESPHGSQEKSRSTRRGEKQTQMISLVQALKFYGTAALGASEGKAWTRLSCIRQL